MPKKKVVVVELVFSVPRMCIRGCHLRVQFCHDKGADPVSGEWRCTTPTCSAVYPFKNWKIPRAPQKEQG